MKLFIIMISLMICSVPMYSQELVQNVPLDDINFRLLYEQEGEQGLMPYTHEAADSALAILEIVDVEGNYLGERNGERLLNFLRILSYAGDLGSKEALIKAMISPKINGSTIAKGLMRLGPQVQPEILSYLDSDKGEDVFPIIFTLNRMAKIDTTGSYVTDDFREKVRVKLVEMLADRANNDANLTLNAVWGLAYYGDESVIPLLEEIDKEDKPELGYIQKTPQEIIDYIKEKK